MRFVTFNSRALVANFVIWSVFIVISLSASFIDSSRAGIQVNVSTRISGYLISFGPWMLITPLFYWFLKKQHQSKQLSPFVSALILLIAWAPFVLFFETLSYTIMRSITDKTLFSVFVTLPIFYWVYNLVLYGVVLGACLSLLFYRRSNVNKMEAMKAHQTNVELELQLSELRIKSLLSQLEPHFLFNSLNAIASLVRITDKKQALTAIKQLSDLLRYATEASSQKFVAFDNELDFVRDYLSLQSLRFDNKLTIALDDKRIAKNQECPPFLLQTFVENAVKHGLERSGEAMALNILITDSNNRLNIRVENTQHPAEQESTGLGIGLNNLRARLKILYQETIDIKTTNSLDKYLVEVSLPTRAKD